MEPWVLVIIAAAVALALAGFVVLLSRRCRGAPEVPLAPAVPSAGERLRQGLRATRRQLAAALGQGAADIDGALGGIEEALVAADVGVRAAGELVARARVRLGSSPDLTQLKDVLREEVEAVLASDPPPPPTTRPWVILVTGVNGVGKTTTIGKLAALHAAAGRRVLLVAADTFRAAAIEQLGVWAERTKAQLVAQAPETSPAAVVFDGVKAALARDVDVVLVDTAGRLHTRTNLMEELRKVRRVLERELPGAPHETLLVVDATTGQNAVAQARTFAEAVGVTGVVLTKLDGTARGGVAIAVCREIGVPLRYVGLGEGVDDLRPFDARQFAAALFEEGPKDGERALRAGD
jgi:fused signal recognition particle receptor